MYYDIQGAVEMREFMNSQFDAGNIIAITTAKIEFMPAEQKNSI